MDRTMLKQAAHIGVLGSGRGNRLGRVARLVLFSFLLYPALYLVFVAPHHGWIDFAQIFAGVRAFWQGDNPYLQDYFNPPWLALALGPLTLLPYDPAAGQFQAAEVWFWLS